MDKLVLIDGNSIMNRAFYGIMGSKMLTTKDGKYTNAVYGFLAILFKILEDIEPQYIAVAFDLKGKLKRKELVGINSDSIHDLMKPYMETQFMTLNFVYDNKD